MPLLKKEINKKHVLAAAVVAVLIIAGVTSAKEKNDSDISYIKRPQPGEDVRSVAIDVYDEYGNKQTTVNTYIEPRKMSEEETQICFDDAYDELLNKMLKDNISVDYITGNLFMPDTLADGLISVSMYSSDYSVIDYDGTVHNEMFENNESKTVTITYIMRYEEYDRQGVIELTVREISAVDENIQKENAKDMSGVIQKVVDNTVNNNTNDENAELPGNIGGKNVHYKYAKEKTEWFIYVVLIAAIIVLVLYRRKMQSVKQQKQRIKELQYDYSELIAKLTLLLGAGMTIRKAWGKMVEDYMKKREAGGEVKTVYEEMYITDCNIRAGISEYEAYEEFGHRCNTREYLKLASLLQTNLKRGTNRLRELLYQESYGAFEQRKNLAKQKGEEATTRLLIPMVMMLLVVMVIIMVPAVMNFYLT